MCDLGRLRDFVIALTHLVEQGHSEATLLRRGADLLAGLVAVNDWLPAAYAQADPVHYQQYLLHCDPLERLSVVSFVWGPGQQTPIHDHGVWGLIGVLQGAEVETPFDYDGLTLSARPRTCLAQGAVSAISPRAGDVHRVCNGLADGVSISIHVYGGNLGRLSRRVFDPATGAAKPFTSRYANQVLPNIWG